jgi:hypothetical protein
MQNSDRLNPSKFVLKAGDDPFFEDSDFLDFEIYKKIYHFEDPPDFYDSDDYFWDQD